MPLCSKCGVRYENSCNRCPLCTGVTEAPSESELQDDNVPAAKHFREVLGFVCFSCSLIMFVTDIAYGMSISWSRIPLLSTGYVWLTGVLLSILKPRGYLMLITGISLTGVFLFLLGEFTAEISWFSEIALPILVSAALLAIAAAGAVRLFSLSFLGTLSVSLVCAGLLTISIDLAVTPGVSWSLVTASGVIPVILFLAGFEKRLERKGSSLSKYFST